MGSSKAARWALVLAGVFPLASASSEEASKPPKAAARGERSALQSDPKGWVDILPGRDLAGWTRVAPISTSGVKSVVRAEVPVWQVKAKPRLLDCRGDLPPAPAGEKSGSHEMLRHDRELGDFIFHVEWRFVDPKREGWNAGIYARVNDKADIWHQAQVGNASGGFWFGDTPDETGKVVRRKLDPGEQRVRPAGQWNTYEITGRGDTLRLWVNGATVSEFTGLRVRRGHVGLEAERHHIQFRTMKLKVL